MYMYVQTPMCIATYLPPPPPPPVESPVEIENPTVMLTIESDSMDVKFKIITDNVGGQEDRVIVLELVYNGDFQDSVVIGGGDTSSTLRITIHDDDGKRGLM